MLAQGDLDAIARVAAHAALHLPADHQLAGVVMVVIGVPPAGGTAWIKAAACLKEPWTREEDEARLYAEAADYLRKKGE